jgi:hypothetical protein
MQFKKGVERVGFMRRGSVLIRSVMQSDEGEESLRKGRGTMIAIFQRSRAEYDTDVIAQGGKGVKRRSNAM